MKPPRKQLSGAAKRRLKRQKAEATRAFVPGVGRVEGELLPPIPTLHDLSSLTGVAREQAVLYREWRFGRLDRDRFLTAVNALRALKDVLVPVSQEQQVQALHEQLQALRNAPTPGRAIDYQQLNGLLADQLEAEEPPAGLEVAP